MVDSRAACPEVRERVFACNIQALDSCKNYIKWCWLALQQLQKNAIF